MHSQVGIKEQQSSILAAYIPLPPPHRYTTYSMPPRRQRTEQLNSPTPERVDALFEVPETQPIVRIPIRSTSESGPSPSQPMTDVQNAAPLPEDVDMADDVAGQDDSIEQMEQRLAAIEAEKRRAHLRHRLVQMEAEKEAGFPVAAFEVSEPSRGDAGLQAALSLKKGLKSKAPELYSGDTQKSFDR